MAVNEIALPVTKVTTGADKILGVLAMLGAPLLLAQFFFGVVWKNADVEKYSPETAALGALYIAGWMCGAIGMFRQRAYGARGASRVVFAIQMTLLALALLFSVQETLGVSYENGGRFFFVCDMGYPASHLFMFVIGAMVVHAKKWTGFARYAPFFVGAALPVTMATGWLLGMIGGMILFGGCVTLGLATIGWRVFKD